MLQLVLFALAVPVCAQTASSAAASPPVPTPSPSPSPRLPPVMPPGSACPDGDNGEWNCLSSCWQRCAAGFWSDTMALAPGTQCIPLGLSFDLQVVHASAPAAPAASTVASTSACSACSTPPTTLGDATCVCSPSSCRVLSSPSPSLSSTPPSPSSAPNDTGLKNSASSGSSALGTSPAIVLGLGLLAGSLLL